MSSFTDNRPVLVPLEYQVNGHDMFQVVYDFEYRIGNKKTDIVTVKSGFKTDLGSVPWWATWLIPNAGQMAKPAILHDWLMEMTDRPYWQCHLILYEAMRVAGFPHWKCMIVLAAVFIKYPYRK